MTGAMIAQLVISLGPMALELIPKLAAVWNKPDLTPAEVADICKVSKTSYDEYIAGAK